MKYEVKIPIVGTGGAQKIDCVEPFAYAICPRCGHVHALTHNCNNWLCSFCYVNVVRRASKSILAHLKSYYDSPLVDHPKRYYHWVYSYNQDQYERLSQMALKDIYNEFIRDFKAAYPSSNSLFVLHLYRVNELGKSYVKTYRLMHPDADLEPETPENLYDFSSDDLLPLGSTLASEYCSFTSYTDSVYHDLFSNESYNYTPRNNSTWEIIRSSKNWREYVNFSPHFHIISAGYQSSEKQQDFRDRGFFVKQVRVMKNDDDIEKTAYYLLTHASYQKGSKVYRYATPVGTRYSAVRVDQSVEKAHCSVCDTVLRVFRPSDNPIVKLSELPSMLTVVRVLNVSLISSKRVSLVVHEAFEKMSLEDYAYAV